MKLWPTTTENKCFVKISWHLLGKCVKVAVLLVCSICTFFFLSSICALFSHISINYIKSGNAATIFCQCSYNIFRYSAILVSHFIFFFFKFWKVATVLGGTAVAIVFTIFFFIFLPFVLFFLLYILLYWHNKFHNIFTIIDVLIFYKDKTYFRPYIFTRFSLWSLTFFFTAFSP